MVFNANLTGLGACTIKKVSGMLYFKSTTGEQMIFKIIVLKITIKKRSTSVGRTLFLCNDIKYLVMR